MLKAVVAMKMMMMLMKSMDVSEANIVVSEASKLSEGPEILVLNKCSDHVS